MEQSWKWGSLVAQKIEGEWCCPSCHESLTLLDEGVDEVKHWGPANDEDRSGKSIATNRTIKNLPLDDEINESRVCQDHASDAELLEIVRRRKQKVLAAGIPMEDNDTLVDRTPRTFVCVETEKYIWFLRPQSAEGMDAEGNDAERLLSCQAVFPCSSCKIPLCRRCKQQAHSRRRGCRIPKDQELERHLEKWDIQRCPKCGHGVRWKAGCQHIKCRCGAHYCWFCRSPVEECRGKNCTAARGRQEGRVTEEEFLMTDGHPAAMGGKDQRDLDQDWEWDEREMDFGEEPEESEGGNVGSCQHHWVVTEESGICHECLEVVPASASGPMAANPDDIGKDSTFGANDTLHQEDFESGQAGHAGLVFQCVNCRILSCNRCRSKEYVTDVDEDQT